MRCNLRPLPLSRIRYLRHPLPQLSQTRRQPSFRPQRLSRMRPHRAPRQELCCEGQISQTDEPRRADSGRQGFSPRIWWQERRRYRATEVYGFVLMAAIAFAANRRMEPCIFRSNAFALSKEMAKNLQTFECG